MVIAVPRTFDLFRVKESGFLDGLERKQRIWLRINDDKLCTESDWIESTASEEEWEKIELVVYEPSEAVYSDDTVMTEYCAGRIPPAKPAESLPPVKPAEANKPNPICHWFRKPVVRSETQEDGGLILCLFYYS